MSEGSRINVNFADFWSGRWESKPTQMAKTKALLPASRFNWSQIGVKYWVALVGCQHRAAEVLIQFEASKKPDCQLVTYRLHLKTCLRFVTTSTAPEKMSSTIG